MKKGGEDEEVRETEQEGKGLASQPYFKGNTKPAVTKYSGIAFTELSPCSSFCPAISSSDADEGKVHVLFIAVYPIPS